MKIRILTRVIVDGSVELPGTIVDTADDMAMLMIAMNSAESAEYVAPTEFVEGLKPSKKINLTKADPQA